jgi:hypothetical protein
MNEPVPLKGGRLPEEDQLIDGGSVLDFVDLEFHAAKHRAHTARWLAYLFVGLLALSIGIHYFATVVLEIYGMSSAAERLGTIYNSWLPVVSSLVSAAATYYFTREKS